MKNKKLILGILAFVIVGIIFISGCAEKTEEEVIRRWFTEIL